jgi:inhibitor of cysteine peptidase
MNWKLLVLAFGIPLALVASGQPAQFNADSNGKTVALKVGDRFDLTLDENATTGYSWEIVDGLDGVLKQLGDPEFHTERSDKHKVGVGGSVTYHFEAVGEGASTLKLVYHRRWEKDKPPVKIFQLTVTVSPKA